MRFYVQHRQIHVNVAIPGRPLSSSFLLGMDRTSNYSRAQVHQSNPRPLGPTFNTFCRAERHKFVEPVGMYKYRSTSSEWYLINCSRCFLLLPQWSVLLSFLCNVHTIWINATLSFSFHSKGSLILETVNNTFFSSLSPSQGFSLTVSEFFH